MKYLNESFMTLLVVDGSRYCVSISNILYKNIKVKGRQCLDYWISGLRSVVEPTFDDAMTKMMISAKIF